MLSRTSMRALGPVGLLNRLPLKLFWPVVAVVLSVNAAVLFGRVKVLRYELDQSERQLNSFEDATKLTISEAYSRIGTKVVVPPLPVVGSTPAGRVRPRVVLVLSDEACEDCEGMTLKFAKAAAAQFGHESVLGVFAAKTRREVEALASSHHITFSLLFDQSHALERTLGVKVVPQVLLINSDGVVVSAHVPMAGREDLSIWFYDAAMRWLAEEPTSQEPKR